jgi:hypothetical protein
MSSIATLLLLESCGGASQQLYALSSPTARMNMGRNLLLCPLEKHVNGENQLEKRVNGEINFSTGTSTSDVLRDTSLVVGGS